MKRIDRIRTMRVEEMAKLINDSAITDAYADQTADLTTARTRLSAANAGSKAR